MCLVKVINVSPVPGTIPEVLKNLVMVYNSVVFKDMEQLIQTYSALSFFNFNVFNNIGKLSYTRLNMGVCYKSECLLVTFGFRRKMIKDNALLDIVTQI